ncbi:hypothetical protein ACETK8_03725 [Brevundimonas staleyi]|uniref:Uncharacterized protein n=1 Tax=Brevundimonas staleyi TaxID=74326 RepID=A0ABW0FVH3_9CAUL
MNHSASDSQSDPVRRFVERSRDLSSEWGPASIADLTTACATRATLLAALDKFPETDPANTALASAQSLVWDMVDEAECFILDQTPADAREAVALLDVLLDGEPQRSDGRDHDALRRIRDLLLGG